ncbi:MAG: HTH-type transcriptional regulator BhcR [Pseudomonadota bacterium]
MDQPQRRPRGRPRSAASEASSGTVQALDRGLHLLRAVASSGGSTLTEIAHSAGLPPSSAHRILLTLQKHQFLDFDETTQEWTVGVEAFRVGSAFAERANLVDASRDVMRRLADDLGETANLGIRHGGDVVFIGQAESHHPIRAFFRPGTRTPLHASGIGKALMAAAGRDEMAEHLRTAELLGFTPQTITAPERLAEDIELTRKRGWAFDNEERFLGMRCVAAAVFDASANPVGGISISGPTVRMADERINAVGARVNTAAREATRLMGG